MSDSAKGHHSTTHFSAQERKRYRKEKKAAERKAPPQPTADHADFAAIPTTGALLTAELRRQLKMCVAANGDGAEDASSSTAAISSASSEEVPRFRVGTLEMYRRFPAAYEAFMSRHDCTSVENYLLQVVLARIVDSAAPLEPSTDTTAAPPSGLRPSPKAFVHVADFGCGTGRIETMVATDARVAAVYAYDGEAAMLRRCVVNTVRAVKNAGHRAGVVLQPTGTVHSADEHSFPPSVPVHSEAVSLVFPREKEEPQEAGECLTLVARPCTFQCIQAGFLAQTSHHPCHLIVCAWSLSYLMRLQWGSTRWHEAVDTVLGEMTSLLDTRTTDAAIVIVETLGSDSATPTRNSTLFERLEEEWGFTRQWVRTDYHFADRAEAERLTRFFFGDKISNKFAGSLDGTDQDATLMECTGIWTLWKPRRTTGGVEDRAGTAGEPAQAAD